MTAVEKSARDAARGPEQATDAMRSMRTSVFLEPISRPRPLGRPVRVTSKRCPQRPRWKFRGTCVLLFAAVCVSQVAAQHRPQVATTRPAVRTSYQHAPTTTTIPAGGEWLQARPRGISLAEARQWALVHNRKIAVLNHVPLERSQDATQREALFDPVFGFGVSGSQRDGQNRSIIDSLGALTNEQQTYQFQPFDQNQIFLEQRNFYGGLARIGFATDYQSVNPAGIFTFVNPGWDSALKFRYEQPLGRGAGVAANTAPIIVASEQAEQARIEVEALVHKTLADVELAYWQLEFFQSTARLHRDFVAEATKILDGEQKRLDNGRGTLPELVRAKERLFRAQVAAHRAETDTAVAEQKLRLLMGIPSLDGTSLVAADHSQVGRYYQRLEQALAMSQSRPDVAAQHAAIRAAQATVDLEENKLRPDLKVFFDYAVTGLEEDFYDSLRTAAGHSFNEWRIGLTFRRPIGLRGEWAGAQKARLTESRQASRLSELELKASNDVVSAYQRVKRTEQEMAIHRSRIEAAQQERDARRELYKNGRSDLEALIDAEDRFLEAAVERQFTWSAAQAAVTLYRFASGAIICGDGLGRSRVQIGDATMQRVAPPWATTSQVQTPPAVNMQRHDNVFGRQQHATSAPPAALHAHVKRRLPTLPNQTGQHTSANVPTYPVRYPLPKPPPLPESSFRELLPGREPGDSP